jgi:hypothetical protein
MEFLCKIYGKYVVLLTFGKLIFIEVLKSPTNLPLPLIIS